MDCLHLKSAKAVKSSGNTLLGNTLTYTITLPEPTYQPDVASSHPLHSQIEASTTEHLLGLACQQET